MNKQSHEKKKYLSTVHTPDKLSLETDDVQSTFGNLLTEAEHYFHLFFIE